MNGAAMATIYWRINSDFVCESIQSLVNKWNLMVKSFTYNHFMDCSYACDVCMEPLFWFVDNFTYAIGPIFVVAVVIMTGSVVSIAYWLGLPYWWNRNSYMCIMLVIIGNWLLTNISFHYYMAVITHAGYPPQGELITEAVSICKKCIAPKPPRTHHCSVCNRCILKMDHHCPWLNNCVGYQNHRYFYLYMAYMVAGVLFLIIFGFEYAYQEIWLGSEYEVEDPELIGHSVRFNKSGALIAVEEMDVLHLDHSHDHLGVGVNNMQQSSQSIWQRRAIIYMALINCGVLFALGGLVAWHSRLICNGETSIEANINRAETFRLAQMGKSYINPYDFGTRKNWKLFLGLVSARSWFRHVFLPSSHEPIGDGLTWCTNHEGADAILDTIQYNP